MDSDVIGRAVFVIEADFGDASEQIREFQNDFGSATSSAQKDARNLDSGLANLTLGVNNLKQAFSMLSGGMSIIGNLTDSYNRYEASMNGVAAVATATGNSVAESLQVVKDVTADGLISPSDAAAAVKNLELYGYSAEQAGQMIRIMGDAAVYNRQATYSVSEAVRVTTEGIRMENSILSDASGITKNIAKMQEEYAASIGTTTNKLTQAEKAQAVYNGVLNEGGVFAGNAEGYTDTLAGAQDKLGTALERTKASLGQLFSALSPVINGIADFINNNQELVGGVVAAAAAIAAGGGLVAAFNLARKAVTAISQSMAVFSALTGAVTGNIVKLGVMAAGLAVGFAAADAIGKAGEESERAASQEDKMANSIKGANNSLASQGVAAEDASKKIAKLNDQLAKLTRDYERDLKQIAVKHEENLQSLNEQIEEANIDYRRAVDERMADFNVTLAKQERSHQETVDELMGQLSFLQRYNNDYNKQKLAQVQFALAKEQELYKRETEAQQAEIDQQNAADKAKLDARLASLQKELADEVAFMEKHREDLNSVRHVILLDEVESLKERYAEQKKSYEEQIAEASTKGAEAANAYWSGYETAQRARLQTIKVQVSKFQDSITWNSDMDKGKSVVIDPRSLTGVSGIAVYNGGRAGGSGWATGGYTGRGPTDEIAGVVHKGEYVIPASQVDQSTGEPKVGNTQNITINLSGTFATSQAERRKVAEQIVAAIAQVNQARLS